MELDCLDHFKNSDLNVLESSWIANGLASVYIGKNRYHKARYILEAVLDARPEDDSALALMARLHRIKDELRQADEFAKKSLALNPENTIALFEVGVVNLRECRFSQARELFESVVFLEPNNADSFHHLGVIARLEGDYDRSLSCLQKAMALNHDQEWIYIELGNLLLVQKEWIGAIELFEKTLSLNPKNDLAIHLLGVVHREQGKIDVAIRCFKQVLVVNPEHIGTLLELGIIHLNRGEENQAQERLKAVIGLDGNNHCAHHHLGILYRQRKAWDLAGKFLDKAMALAPDNAWTVFELGVLALNSKNVSKAIDYFEATIRIDPAHVAAYYQLGKLLSADNRCSGLIVKCEQFLNNPPTLEARSEIGKLYFEDNDYENARIQFEMTVQVEPDHFLAHHYLGVIHRLAGDFERARSYFEMANRLNSENEWPFLELGLLHMEGMFYEDAIRLFRDTLKINPSNEVGGWLLTMAYRVAGDQDRAEMFAERLIERRPAFLWIYLESGLLALSRGDNTAAITAFKQLQKISPARDSRYRDIARRYTWRERLGVLSTSERREGEVPISTEPISEGMSLFLCGWFADAITCLKPLLADPQYGYMANYFVGLCHRELSEYTFSLQYLQEAVAVMPLNEWILADLGIACLFLKEASRALSAFKQILPIHPFQYPYAFKG